MRKFSEEKPIVFYHEGAIKQKDQERREDANPDLKKFSMIECEPKMIKKPKIGSTYYLLSATNKPVFGEVVSISQANNLQVKSPEGVLFDLSLQENSIFKVNRVLHTVFFK